ncbi:unnamed protein product [Ilex paraguariensis]|uniref:Apple domain-containing protein n=1 Tax=Ilex paraguariensis TaxID=185542 RepID=A0ABC8TF80_9AQUA
MERQFINSVTRFRVTQLLLITTTLLALCTTTWFGVGAATDQELVRGFKATPDHSISSFQALLRDSAGNYSLGFLRVNRTELSLAVVHVPSSEPLWFANMTRLARWSDSTQLFFNGSLVVSDPQTKVFWSSNTNGDRVWLSNTSNLEIQKLDGSHTILWQSFQFPTDTLVENQNFTSAMSLVSSNGLYSMRLGSDFMGLYAKFNGDSGSDQIYCKHKALEAKADIIEGQPIYALLNPNGYLGMYQNGSAPVDVQSFNSFQQSGSGIRRVRIEPDGNLKGYYWTGFSWILDYQAISEPCELPSSCGSYGLCQPGKDCSCLDNRTEHNSGGCISPENGNSGDFCSVYDQKYKVFRRSGVELPYKELMGSQKMASLERCESACELNCSCWGAVYNNNSGFCYMLDYPIQTLVGVGDLTKVGYFKVKEGVGKRKMDGRLTVVIGLLCGLVLLFGGVVGIGLYRISKRKRGIRGMWTRMVG